MKTALHGLLSSILRAAIALCLLAATSAVQAQVIATFTHLYDFARTGNGVYPTDVVLGDDGNFYGTTPGGEDGDFSVRYGTVFQITPAGVLTTLYVFTGGADGAQPGDLSRGHDGNFYSFTYQGGANNLGTLFQVTPAGQLTTLYTFTTSNLDTSVPRPVIQASDGNFYGTTEDGGDNGRGTVFQITANGVFNTLHTFPEDGAGQFPGPLVEGADGNLYGTTNAGGPGYEQGIVFQVTPAGAFTVLYVFAGDSDGGQPSGLVPGSDGNLYGTTTSGGTGGGGTIFQITPAGVLTTLHSFAILGDLSPDAALSSQGRDGNLYGSTLFNGPNKKPALFQLTPGGVFTTLSAFPEAAWPLGLMQGDDGNLYSTTRSSALGGSLGSFVKFALGTAPSPFFAGEEPVGEGVYYLGFNSGNFFGYYTFSDDPHYIYHFDLGDEYVFDANDGKSGIYLYDFPSQTFFYTSPIFPFPYLYDFTLNTVLYYYPDPSHAGHYNTEGIRYFYDFATGEIIEK